MGSHHSSAANIAASSKPEDGIYSMPNLPTESRESLDSEAAMLTRIKRDIEMREEFLQRPIEAPR